MGRFNIMAAAGVFMLFLGMAQAAQAATLSVTVNADRVAIGDSIQADVKINSGDVGINAAQATLSFPKDILEVTSLDRGGSVFNFWLQEPSFSNDAGEVSFVGGSTAGVNGASLQVLRVHFKVRGSGRASIAFSDGAVTASDGSGTNVLSAMRGAAVQSVPSSETSPPLGTTPGTTPPPGTQTPPPATTSTAPLPPVIIAPPKLIERTAAPATRQPNTPVLHLSLFPDPQKWYNLSASFFASWDLPLDVTDVADLVDQKPNSTPTKPQGLFDGRSYQITQDGVWYLHVRFKNGLGWGPASHYRLALDRTPPLPFSITVREGLATDNPTPTVDFTTGDELSGMAGYTFRLDDQDPFAASSTTFTLPRQKPGRHDVRVIASDLAGNTRESDIVVDILPIKSPAFTSLSQRAFIGEGGITAGGTALPDVAVHLSIRKNTGDLMEQMTAQSDSSGNWDVVSKNPLTKGTYVVEAVAEDARGAQSLVVKSSPVSVRERPALIIGGVEITQAQLMAIMVFLLLAAFVAGAGVFMLWRRQMGYRVTMAARDVAAAFSQTRKDVDTCLERLSRTPLDARGVQEIQFQLKNMGKRLDKAKTYVVENVEEIRE